MSIAPLSFTGVSQFSTDFQSILTRAVSIASIPVQNLQNQQANLLQKKQLTTALSSSLASLATAVGQLGTVGQSQGLVASSSDPSTVTAVNSGADGPVSYQITEITSVAKSALETSLSGFPEADNVPVSATGHLSLTLGATSYPITLATGKNNLAGLRDAINASGAGVTATILTTGTGLTPNYLSVSANSSGATTLSLVDDPSGAKTALLTNTNQGDDAIFKLNDLEVHRSSNTVNDLIPGVSLSINNTTAADQTVTVTLAPDRSQITNALNSLATNYNAVANLVNAQIGTNAGLLSGDVAVREASNALRQITSFRGVGDVSSLAELGISLSTTGQMSLDSTAVSQLSDSQLAAAFTFLGSSTSGLGSVAGQISALSDPVTGLLKIEQDKFDETYKSLGNQVDTLTSRVNAMQAGLSQKLQIADSLLANLESQQNTLAANIQSLVFTTFGKQLQ
jgi:flagellar hook-associated protein 2